jgi:hypothetical protein
MVQRTKCLLLGCRASRGDTAFSKTLPTSTSEGLFAFDTQDEALAAIEAIEADYPRHSHAAHEIADQYFRAERVLGKVLAELGL